MLGPRVLRQLVALTKHCKLRMEIAKIIKIEAFRREGSRGYGIHFKFLINCEVFLGVGAGFVCVFTW